MPDSSLRVARVPGKGRGIIARRRIAEAEVIETAPVVVVPAREWPLVQQTTLGRYCFEWDDDTGSVAVALGLGSLINHSYAPNLMTEKDLRGRRMVFVALRDIDAGEELTLNYNGQPDSTEPVGFDVKDT